MKSMKNMKIGTTKKMKILPNDKVKMFAISRIKRGLQHLSFCDNPSGGVSKGAYASFNPGEYSGDNPEAVRANRKLLSDAIRIPSERIFAPFQVHGAEVRSIEPSFLSLPLEEQQLYMHGVDALVTDVPEVLHRCLDSRLCPCLAVCSRCEGCSCRSCRLAGNCIADCRENCSHPHG